MIGLAQIFIYLQILDLLTTLVGFKMGASELSPFIRMLMHLGPAAGVIASKVIALGLAGLCMYLGKTQLLRWASYWYGGLVIWNLGILLAAPGYIG